ncbi:MULTISPECIES: restriction endonuclease, partial [unclassified Pseudoalteromonas]
MELCETSKDYELLTQKIYRAILESEGVENIDVQHDVKIKGKSGVEHKIDVFWEYRYAGVSHKILIECKYYSKPVSLIHARNMLGLLNDIPNSQGLIVTTQGFQSGVIDFCGHYEINLKRIRTPQGTDWDGYIQIINVNGELYQNQYLDMKLAFDGKDYDTKKYFDKHGSQIS